MGVGTRFSKYIEVKQMNRMKLIYKGLTFDQQIVYI